MWWIIREARDKKWEITLSDIPHIPVLYDEVLEIFSKYRQELMIDCTAGFGGHSEGLLRQHKDIRLVCNDQDSEALKFCEARLQPYKDRVIYSKANFGDVVDRFRAENITGILADIGVSSYQLDNLDRGFGFDSDSLDMRMDTQGQTTAYDVVNNYDTKSLETILKEYGEIRDYKNIAQLIVSNRPIVSGKQLSQIVAKSSYIKHGKHPATLLFQAVRIEVNKELLQLEKLLKSLENLALKDCIVAIISFHSLEDRIVKQVFNRWSKSCICPIELPRCVCGNNHSIGHKITKKPIVATRKECLANPRARSAKIRVFRIKR